MAQRRTLDDPADPRQALLDQLGPDPSPPAQPRTLSNSGAAPSLDPYGNPTTPSPSGPLPPSPGPASYTPPTTGPFAPNATPTPTGTPGTFQYGSPNDPTKYTDPSQLLGLQLNQGLSPQQAATAINSYFKLGTGSQAQVYAGKGPNGTDIISLANPNGYYTNNGGTWTWNPRGPEGPAPTPTLSGTNATNFGQITMDPATAAYSQQLRDFMTSQLGQLSAPTTANSPEIAPALSAFNNQSQRDQEQQDAATAEQFYATGEGGVGTNSGGFRTALTQGREHAAMNRANFTGSTIFQAAQQKRQRLQEMLSTASQFGMTQQAQQIQMQIAQIDAQLRAQGLSQQNSQFGDSLGFNVAQLQAQMNRDALLAGLGGG